MFLVIKVHGNVGVEKAFLLALNELRVGITWSHTIQCFLRYTVHDKDYDTMILQSYKEKEANQIWMVGGESKGDFALPKTNIRLLPL